MSFLSGGAGQHGGKALAVSQQNETASLAVFKHFGYSSVDFVPSTRLHPHRCDCGSRTRPPPPPHTTAAAAHDRRRPSLTSAPPPRWRCRCTRDDSPWTYIKDFDVANYKLLVLPHVEDVIGFHPERAAQVKAFIKAGGSVLLTGRQWEWLSTKKYNQPQGVATAANHPFNLVLATEGVTVNSGTIHMHGQGGIGKSQASGGIRGHMPARPPARSLSLIGFRLSSSLALVRSRPPKGPPRSEAHRPPAPRRARLCKTRTCSTFCVTSPPSPPRLPRPALSWLVRCRLRPSGSSADPSRRTPKSARDRQRARGAHKPPWASAKAARWAPFRAPDLISTLRTRRRPLPRAPLTPRSQHQAALAAFSTRPLVRQRRRTGSWRCSRAPSHLPHNRHTSAP